MDINKLIEEYFGIQAKIYEYFGYKENWKVFPLEDQRDQYWFITHESKGVCVFSPSPFTLESLADGEEIYSGPIYTQRHLPKWVYRAETLTLACVDTQTDGNKFLMIFDNAKEEKRQEIIDAY